MSAEEERCEEPKASRCCGRDLPHTVELLLPITPTFLCMKNWLGMGRFLGTFPNILIAKEEHPCQMAV